MHDSWRNPFITQLPVMPDRVMLGLFNYGKDEAIDTQIEIDLAALGLDLGRVFTLPLWVDAAGEAKLDADTGVLQVRDLPGHRLLLIGLAAPTESELKRAAQALPTRMTGFLPPSITDFGLVDPATNHFEPGQAPELKWDNAAIEVTMWRLPDRVMLAVQNMDAEAAQDAAIHIDLDALDLTPQLPWQEFVGLRDLWQTEGESTPASLDYHQRIVTVEDLAPQAVKLIGIRRY
jgi:hypothetical protein